MEKLDKVLYTARVHTTGGRDGNSKSDDGKLEVRLTPPAMNGPGTNPEELIGAAHAGCFSMALSAQLSGAGAPPERIETKAEITFEKVGEGFAITASHLTVSAKVPGLDAAKFQELATKAKEGCPVSKVLNAKISLAAKLAS